MPIHEKIDYAEYPAKDLVATKSFFQTVFGWSFTDYGPDYTAFSDEGLGGGLPIRFSRRWAAARQQQGQPEQEVFHYKVRFGHKSTVL